MKTSCSCYHDGHQQPESVIKNCRCLCLPPEWTYSYFPCSENCVCALTYASSEQVSTQALGAAAQSEVTHCLLVSSWPGMTMWSQPFLGHSREECGNLRHISWANPKASGHHYRTLSMNRPQNLVLRYGAQIGHGLCLVPVFSQLYFILCLVCYTSIAL